MRKTQKKTLYTFIQLIFNMLLSRVIVRPVVYKLKMINQDRMIFGDFTANSQPISFKFCKGHFLFKS